MGAKRDYKVENESFLDDVARRVGIESVGGGVLREVIAEGNGVQPGVTDVVAVFYKGSLIDGQIFDDNTSQDCPDVFRLGELIAGWQIALTRMRVGDKWRIYVPARHGYGAKVVCGIPKHSTLIFEIELVNVY